MNKSSDIELSKDQETETINMADDHPEWFNTQELIYLKMKKNMPDKFVDEDYWGEFGTDQQVMSVFRNNPNLKYLLTNVFLVIC